MKTIYEITEMPIAQLLAVQQEYKGKAVEITIKMFDGKVIMIKEDCKWQQNAK